TYDATRARVSASDRAAAVQTACQQIRDVIREQWELSERQEQDRVARIRALEESQAIQRLQTVSSRLRDALFTLQRDALAAFSDRAAFDQLKRRTAEEVSRIVDSFAVDAKAIGVQAEIENLRSATCDALVDLPFPEELSQGQAALKQKAFNA